MSESEIPLSESERAELDELRIAVRAVYFHDGTSKVLDTPEAVVDYRKMCARRIDVLETQLARAMLAAERVLAVLTAIHQEGRP